jgi:hypothetical protein
MMSAIGCAQKDPATGCHSNSQCAEGSRCISTVCTASARPTASVLPLGPVEAFALVQLDGSGSSDTDGDLAEYLWTTRIVEARCAPPEVTSRTPRASVRFGCQGRFQVGLTVRDTLGLESTQAIAEVVVIPATGASAVVAGEDVASDHVCSSTQCGTTDPVQLSAVATQGNAVRWIVEPPAELPLDGSRHVVFSPSASVPAPAVSITTDGSAISGDWVFRVEALDAYGVVGVARTRVSVRNRPPVVHIAPAGPFPHLFDPVRSVFVSSGALAWSVDDPDGDDVEIKGIWRHVGDGDATFDGDFTGTTATFVVAVPYSAPEDALRLRGGPGLSRRIELVALDSNGANARAYGDVIIGNRPPIPAGGSFSSAVPHRFDPARSAYVATVAAGTYVDPDGDPLFGGVSENAPCATVRMDGNNAFVECAATYDGIPDVQRLVGTRIFTVPVRDPWEAIAPAPARTVQILNGAPTVSGVPVPATTCVRVYRPFGALRDSYSGGEVTFDFAPQVVDPDGDPVRLDASPAPFGGTVNPITTVCTEASCSSFRFYEPPLFGVEVTRPNAVRSFLFATDGTPGNWFEASPAWVIKTTCP